MKKKIIFAALTVVLAAGVFAEGNTIAGGLGLISADISYERSFNEAFSLLIDASYNNFFVFAEESAIAAKARFYFKGVFYIEGGLGYGSMIGVAGSMGRLLLLVLTLGLLGDKGEELRVNGLLATLGLGWKIDIGKPNGFVLPINLGLDYVRDKDSDRFDFLPWARIGLGYSF